MEPENGFQSSLSGQPNGQPSGAPPGGGRVFGGQTPFPVDGGLNLEATSAQGSQPVTTESVGEILPEFPLLHCTGLTKNYGATTALNAVTFSIPRGRVVGLLGPNGSGKTTLIKIAAGLLHQSSGQLLVAGHEPGSQTKAITSYLPERPYFAPSMKVCKALDFFKEFYADFDRAMAEEMLMRLEVPLSAHMGGLSKGTKEKVQLVLVMARRAGLYLLDEPIGGVDPATREYILDTIISHYHRDSTILLSTHLVADVEHVLDDFILLQYGTVAMYSKPQWVREQMGMGLDAYFREVYRCSSNF